jgi:hypothetical protein
MTTIFQNERILVVEAMTMTTEHFVQLLPRQLRLLERLIEQKKVDLYGGIGWRGLLEGEDDWPMDQLFKPLLERGLIEDLTAVPDFGTRSGQYFVRITPLGKLCASYGWMLKATHTATEKEMEKFAGELKKPSELGEVAVTQDEKGLP